MNRSSINKNKKLLNNRIYSDTVSLNLYNKPSIKNNDDTRSISIRSYNRKNSFNEQNISKTQPTKLSNSRILNHLSSSQSKLKSNNTESRLNKKGNIQTKKLQQSLVKPVIKQTPKPPQKIVSKPSIQTKPIPKVVNTPQIQRSTSISKITPQSIETIKYSNQDQNNKLQISNLNNLMELDTKSQCLKTNKPITIKSSHNLDNYTEYTNSYIECVSDNSKYIIKPEYLTFQKSSDYKSYYGIDQVKLSLIDKNQNTLSATIINPLSISTKEINLFNGSIEKSPINDKDIVNKKYVDEQINKNDKTNKHITKLAEQINTNIDAINTIQKRINNLRDNVSSNMKELNQKINDNQNNIKDLLKLKISEININDITSKIKDDLANNSLTVNELTVNKLIIPESLDHIKFDNYLDCNNIILHNIECMNNGNYNSLEIKLDNRYDIHIYDDDDNHFSFKPYSGIIESDNGIVIQKYREYDDNATRITSDDITTKRIQLLNEDENGEQTIIIMQPINIDGQPKLQLAMKYGDYEEIIYFP